MKITSNRVGCGGDFADRGRDCRALGPRQAHIDRPAAAQPGPGRPGPLLRNTEHDVTRAVPRHPQDGSTSGHDRTRLGIHTGDHASGVGNQYRVLRLVR